LILGSRIGLIGALGVTHILAVRNSGMQLNSTSTVLGTTVFLVTVAKFNWDSKVPFDQFDVRSIDNARNATENQGYRDRFLASIRDRLGTAAVKGQAFDLCQELFLADGARSDEEDAVLQNLRKLLE
jgi:hypothetical protein